MIFLFPQNPWIPGRRDGLKQFLKIPLPKDDLSLFILNHYHKSAAPHPRDIPTRKNKRRENKVKYRKEFKEQALLLSDKLGVKKAAGQLGISYG